MKLSTVNFTLFALLMLISLSVCGYFPNSQSIDSLYKDNYPTPQQNNGRYEV